MSDEKRTLPTLDEILAAVGEIARDDSDRDRFKALKMLAALNTGTVAIAPPASEKEMVDRLVRLMRSAGPRLCQEAYQAAYPLSKRKPVFDREEVPQEVKDKVSKIFSLQHLYRIFPALRKPGVPVGYPSSAGPEVKLEFVRRMATKAYMDREREKKAMERQRAEQEKQEYDEQFEPEDDGTESA